MTGVELATAYVSIVVSGDKIAPEVKRQFGKVGTEAERTGKSAGKRFGAAFGSGLKLLGGAALGGGIVSFLKSSNDEAREAQKVGARTANVIKTTGGAANISANQVGNLATAISNKVGIDDEAIQSGANLLLTFKNVRNEVGKGNKVFDRATQAAVDLSASGFGDLNGASKQLGKALNDPVKGITALARAGVTFTDQQKAQIKTLVKSGKTLQAQKIILKEVESQVGGSAAAQATAGDKARVSIKNLEEQIGTALLPTVDKLANFVSKKGVPAVSKFVAEFQKGTGVGGDVRDVLEDIVGVGKGVLKFFRAIPAPVGKFAAEAGLAYLALSKLKVISGGSALIGGLRNLTSGLATSESRMTTTAKVSGKLSSGLRNLGGGAGLLLVADSARRTGTALGALETVAGGALTGFAVGGPIGAAVGAGVGLVGALAGALFHSRDEAKKAAPAFSDYAASLDEVTGASTRATKQLIFQDLTQNGILKSTRELGISDRTVVQGLAGNIGARRSLVSQLKAQQIASDLLAGKQVAAAAQDLKSGKLSAFAYLDRLKAIRATNAATERNISALLKQAGVIDKDRLAQLQSNVATAQGEKAINAARRELEAYGRTHGVGTVELHGYGTVKKQALELQALLRGVFALNGKAHPKLQQGGSLADILGIDILKPKKHREFGGPVSRNVAYTVGERRPEVFVPNQSGRIVPKIAAASAVATAPNLSGARLTLHIAGRQIEGVLEDLADSRVDSAAALRGEQDRAFG